MRFVHFVIWSFQSGSRAIYSRSCRTHWYVEGGVHMTMDSSEGNYKHKVNEQTDVWCKIYEVISLQSGVNLWWAKINDSLLLCVPHRRIKIKIKETRTLKN